MKFFLYLLVLISWQEAISQVQRFEPQKKDVRGFTIPCDFRNLDVDSVFIFRNKTNGKIIYKVDTSFTYYSNCFNDRYYMIKQLKSSIGYNKNIASSFLVPINDAVIFDSENPDYVYVYTGSSDILVNQITFFKKTRRHFILITKEKKKIIFRRFKSPT